MCQGNELRGEKQVHSNAEEIDNEEMVKKYGNNHEYEQEKVDNVKPRTKC